MVSQPIRSTVPEIFPSPSAIRSLTPNGDRRTRKIPPIRFSTRLLEASEKARPPTDASPIAPAVRPNAFSTPAPPRTYAASDASRTRASRATGLARSTLSPFSARFDFSINLRYLGRYVSMISTRRRVPNMV